MTFSAHLDRGVSNPRALAKVVFDRGNWGTFQVPSEPKPSPPNWANTTSALVAAAIALTATVGWGVRLEMRVNALERDNEVLAKRQAPSSVSNEKDSATCAELIQQMIALREKMNYSDANELKEMIEGMGCVVSKKKIYSSTR